MQEDSNLAYFSSALNSGNELELMMEELVPIIFQTKYLKEDKENSFKYNWVDHVKWNTSHEVHFTIHQNGSKQKNTCTAYMLNNGLPYAFSDDNGHKVQTITKASFPLPNKAVIKITDHRSKERKNLRTIHFLPENSAFVLGEEENRVLKGQSDSVIYKSFALKCGTAFSIPFHANAGDIYLEPGDTINITIPNDKTPLLISNNSNSIWWQNNKDADVDEIKNAPISNEFKSYLILSHEINKVVNALHQMSNEDLPKSMLPFYSLKSYHYNSLASSNTLCLLQRYLRIKKYQIWETGSTFHNGFSSAYYFTVPNSTDFHLYFDLFNLLHGQFAFNAIVNKRDKYDEYLTRCGDTLLTSKLKILMDARCSILPGKELPFKTVLSDSMQEVNILPQKKDYALLMIYYDPGIVEDFLSLSDNLSLNVEIIAYANCNNRLVENSNNSTLLSGFKRNNYSSLYGHPDQLEYFANITGNKYVNSILILYDVRGQILYSKRFGMGQMRELDLKQYKDEIQNAIDKNEQKSKTNKSSIILWAGLALFVGVFLTILVYRMVIQRMKKQNAQSQLIQELKLKSVQSQLNPHFVFNALNSIQHLINASETKQANRYLIGFSNLLRGVLDNADKRIVPLSDEIEMIQQYCELEKLRLQFKCTIHVETQTPADLIEVPYMLLQPLVENSIKHGVAKQQEAGEINMRIFEKDTALQINIRDNGPGINGYSINEMTMKGKGLKLTLEKLQGIYGEDAHLHISEQQGWTEASIQIKIG